MRNSGKKSATPLNERSLFKAIEKSQLETIKRLLKEKVSPNAAEPAGYFRNRTALMYAAGCQYPEAVEILLKAGADPRARTGQGEGSSEGYTALHAAIDGSNSTGNKLSPEQDEECRLRIIDALLQAGADPEAVYDGDSTPLYEACSAGYRRIVNRLLQICDLKKRSSPSNCKPPLYGAALGRQSSIVQLLLERGHPVDVVTPNGLTALCAAAYRGADAVLEILLNQGANVNHRSVDGRTPLISAAMFAADAVTEREHQVAVRIIKRLVEAGADLSAHNKDGRTALEIAKQSENREVIRLLKGSNRSRAKR